MFNDIKNNRVVKELLFYYKPHVKVMFYLLAGSVVMQLLALSVPYLSGKIIDGLINHESVNYLLLLAFITFVVLCMQSLIDYVATVYGDINVFTKINTLINTSTLERLSKFSIGQFNNQNSGLKQSVINDGINGMDIMVNITLNNLIPTSAQLIITIIALAFLSPILGSIVLIGAIVYIYLMLYFSRTFNPERSKEKDIYNEQRKVFSEQLRYLSLIKMFARDKEEVERLQKGRTVADDFSINIWTTFLKNYTSSGLILHLVRFSVIAVGIALVANGQYTPGALVIFISWANQAFGRISNLGNLQRNFLNQYTNIDKYAAMLEIAPAINPAEKPIKMDQIAGAIKFDHVSFKYPVVPNADGTLPPTTKPEKNDDANTLVDVSFDINAGETVAIVGHSGAGKTTLVNLLLRGYDPDSGVIRVDGHDLREIDENSYRTAVGYVEQNVELFDRTLRENILLGIKNPETISNERLEEVARKARIDQFFDRLGEKKFEMIIGEKGIRLSGGERQRVGIARALIKNPQVLIFDEATSSLDAENEALIHDAMRDALEGRTGIIIAHRLSTIRDADKIIVMEKGSVACIGTHDELKENCEMYKRLIERQVSNL